MIASYVNEIFLTVTTISVHDFNSDNFSINKFDFDTNKSDFDIYFKSDDSNANKSDSNIYFKSDDSNFNNEYNHKLYKKLTHKKMARILKLKDKSSTKLKEWS